MNTNAQKTSISVQELADWRQSDTPHIVLDVRAEGHLMGEEFTFQGQPRAIVEYAYENTGAPILAGAIPEPSTLALLSVMGLGAVGVRAWRKRKAA